MYTLTSNEFNQFSNVQVVLEGHGVTELLVILILVFIH